MSRTFSGDIGTLETREINYNLKDSIRVGISIIGMIEELDIMNNADAREWIEWHDKWEAMDTGTQDSYLVLLALKGD